MLDQCLDCCPPSHLPGWWLLDRTSDQCRSSAPVTLRLQQAICLNLTDLFLRGRWTSSQLSHRQSAVWSIYGHYFIKAANIWYNLSKILSPFLLKMQVQAPKYGFLLNFSTSQMTLDINNYYATKTSFPLILAAIKSTLQDWSIWRGQKGGMGCG